MQWKTSRDMSTIISWYLPLDVCLVKIQKGMARYDIEAMCFLSSCLAQFVCAILNLANTGLALIKYYLVNPGSKTNLTVLFTRSSTLVVKYLLVKNRSWSDMFWRTPRKNVCACVNLTCNSIANLMRSRSERFRRLKMAVKRSDFIVRLYSQISSAKINISF